MNRFRVAAAIPAVTFALVLPAVAYAHGQGQQNGAATDSTMVQAQSEQQTPASATGAAASDSQQTPGGTNQTDKDARKHAPTAQMDRATPPDKSPPETPSSAKHPPTSQMDRAAPQEKSPPDAQGASGDTSTSSTRQ